VRPLAEDDGDDLREVVARLSGDEPLDRRTRAGLVGRLAVLLSGQGRRLVDVVVDVAPHIPIRDRATLREHHRGLDDHDLAEALIATASRVTGAIGAAGGLLSTVEFTAPPLLLSAPVQVAAETLAVVAVEVKLIGELHEVYGRAPAAGTTAQAAGYLGAWVRRRALDPFTGSGGIGGVGGVLGGAARRELRQRLLRRAGRNVTTVAPFLAGAVAGAALNQRETRRLGERISADLRRS
jgi:uncharacterized membrane protein YoaK (UPF0700 family)